MKTIKLLLAGLALPAGFVSAITFSSISQTVATPNTVERPYVIEIYAADGHAENTTSGVSNETDPFVIAEKLGAAPVRADKFTAFPDIKMDIGSKITLYRSPSIALIDGKKKSEIRSWAETVQGLLSEQNIDLAAEDKITPALDASIGDKSQIKITRVAIAHVDKLADIDFKAISKNDNTLDKGKTRVEQKGVKGQKKLTYEIRREDGVEVARKLINTEIVTTAIDQITIIGTKPVITGWCKYNDLVLDASIKNGIDPDRVCALMRKESNGNADSVSGGGHLGLFQYTEGFWADVSAKAGYSGASWDNAKAQIYTTAWALTHGYSSRWGGTFK